MSLSEGCDVALYISKLVSELLFHDGKQLNTTACAGNSLYDALHTLQQTLEK